MLVVVLLNQVGVSQGVDELVVRLFLKDLSVFKTVDQLELFLFHLSNFVLVHLLFISFTCKFLLDLTTDPGVLFELVHLTFGGSVMLLLTNHILHLLSLRFLSVSVLHKLLSDGFFLELSLVCLSSSVIDRLQLLNLCALILLFLRLVVHLGLSLSFSFQNCPPLVLLLLSLNVTASLSQDLLSTLPGLVDFLDSLRTN